MANPEAYLDLADDFEQLAVTLAELAHRAEEIRFAWPVDLNELQATVLAVPPALRQAAASIQAGRW